MAETRRAAIEKLYDVLQAYERLYQFRDPNNACLFDLRVNECYVLQLIVEQGPLSVAEIAAALGIHKSNASRIAHALGEKNYTKSATDKDDKRSVLWDATATGKKKMLSIKKYLVDRFSATLHGYRVSELAKLSEALERLAADAQSRMSDQCV